MKLLIITNYFPPEIGAASHLFFELAESLVDVGIQVTVLTGFPRYNLKRRPPAYRHKWFMTERVPTKSNGTISVVRVGCTSIPFSRAIPVLRGLDHLWTAKVFLFRALALPRHDCTLIYSPPLTLGITARWLKLLKRTPFIVNVQDLFPQNAIDLGVLKNKILIRLFQRMERYVYRHADLITVHSDANKTHVQALLHDATDTASAKVHTIPNWVDTNAIRPGPKRNAFTKRYNIPIKKYIVSFAGVLGYSQGTQIIVEAAQLLHNEQDIHFIIVGEGPDRPHLEKLTANSPNVSLLPLQPQETYPQVLAASDLCLVTLKASVKTPVVPSKILSIMAAGRPIIASMPLNGDAPKLIKHAKAGVVLKPERADLLAQAILELSKNPELCKKYSTNGRAYAETYLSRESIVKMYLALFKTISP